MAPACGDRSTLFSTFPTFVISTAITCFWWVVLFCVNSYLISVSKNFYTLPTSKWPVCWFATNLGMHVILHFLAKHFLTIVADYHGIIFLWFLFMFLQFLFWNFCFLVTAIIPSSYVTII